MCPADTHLPSARPQPAHEILKSTMVAFDFDWNRKIYSFNNRSLGLKSKLLASANGDSKL